MRKWRRLDQEERDARMARVDDIDEAAVNSGTLSHCCAKTPWESSESSSTFPCGSGQLLPFGSGEHLPFGSCQLLPYLGSSSTLRLVSTSSLRLS